ncbi:tRNA (guanosine(46)-N7)-methyltransferase TrmB [Breznakiella homolactica]|uniref:tRNA (guanine-N(7)-)-methyltransferase n=1 Tax=Breznakiella homolactica TaxID=2798577 RepID=A0A7T8BAG9_9SPIR|nr:tRNA (guanosine(46)-N7)-methyltransferase TrmB [Breznakiella homolactica]QQO08208.1 tRNA (guanosine(46)-N7)-methyltransferase TrmB [Breznakiella homolactica]
MNTTESAGSSGNLKKYSPVKSYVLRAGRMSDAQRRSYDTLSPRYCIPAPSQGGLDIQGIFGNGNPLCVEIGFGMGVATAQIAADNPGINYLGIEVHRPGIGRLLWEIEQRNLGNIRILEYDAAEVLAGVIEDGSVTGFHVFFPDPWPKKRHHKRRLIKRPFTELLGKKLSPGGYVYMVTDWEDYARWALTELEATPNLENSYEGFAPHQEWRPETKFERKGIDKNHAVWELMFRRRR